MVFQRPIGNNLVKKSLCYKNVPGLAKMWSKSASLLLQTSILSSMLNINNYYEAVHLMLRDPDHAVRIKRPQFFPIRDPLLNYRPSSRSRYYSIYTHFISIFYFLNLSLATQFLCSFHFVTNLCVKFWWDWQFNETAR